MARDVIVFHGEEGGFLMDSNGCGLYLICMIVASLSLLSMVVFACGDSGNKPRRRGGIFGGSACNTGGGTGCSGGGGTGCGGSGGGTGCGGGGGTGSTGC
ncbi:hypothetical protein SLA2020_442130 [Shorea laevis]